jgi:hypothetical protein
VGAGCRLVVGFPAAEGVFVEIHVDAFAAEFYAFHGEPETLLGCGFEAEFDLAADADYALPGKRADGWCA